MGRLLLITALLIIVTMPSYCQHATICDSDIYKKYLSSNKLKTALSPKTILAIYSVLATGEQACETKPPGNPRSLGYLADQYQALSGVIAQPDMLSNYNWKQAGSLARLPHRLRKRMKAEIAAYRLKEGDSDSARITLAANLEAFDSLSQNKPLFFLLFKDQRSDPATFAKHIYDHSIVTNPRMLKAFMKHPSAELLRKDPGVQFILGLALYELWLKRGGEAAAAEPQDSTVSSSQTDSIPAK